MPAAIKEEDKTVPLTHFQVLYNGDNLLVIIHLKFSDVVGKITAFTSDIMLLSFILYFMT